MCINCCINFFCRCKRNQHPNDIQYELLNIDKHDKADALASLKNIIEQRIPHIDCLDDLKASTYEDPEGYSITYTHDLINEYRVLFNYNNDNYQGASTTSWYEATQNLFTTSEEKSLEKTAETILNPYA